MELHTTLSWIAGNCKETANRHPIKAAGQTAFGVPDLDRMSPPETM
jgi:hypothetical protein